MNHSKKYSIIIISFILLFLFLTLPQLKHSAVSELHDKKNGDAPLLFVNSTTFHPYSMLDKEGEAQGIFIDYWKTAARKVNLNIRFELMDWDESLEAIKTKKADVHAGLFMTEKRTQYMDFSDPYLFIRTVLMMQSGLKLDSPKDLKNITIGLVRGDAAGDYLRKKYPFAKIIEYDDSHLIIEDVLKGKVQALASDGDWAYYYLYQKNSLGRMVTHEILYTEGIRAGVVKGDYKTLELLNKAISLMTEEEVRKIKDKWGYIEPYSLFRDRRLIITAIISIVTIGFIILIILWFNWLLKRKVAEQTELLRQSQKFEVIGTLASGLAHDFNNILMGVIGPVSEMLFTLKTRGEIRQEDILIYLPIMKNSANRATDIVKRLLTLSSAIDKGTDTVNLNVILKNIELICRTSLHKGIHVEVNYPVEDLYVKADPTHIEQILLNICINAAHAMTIMRPSEDDAGGELTIIAKEVPAGDPFLLTHETAKGERFCSISIRDTGIGMSEEVLKKIFDPFFTTKPERGGTGLGMTVVYNIIKLYNGDITIFSKENTGTTIHVFLPLYDSIFEKNEKDEHLIDKGEGLILVIDDEEMVLEVAERMLSRCGYNVLTAKNSVEAIALYEKKCKEIDVVILDVFLGSISGKKIFKELHKINNNVRVIIVSGNSVDKSIDDLMNMGALMFLQKPYSFEDICCAVSEVKKSAK